MRRSPRQAPRLASASAAELLQVLEIVRRQYERLAEGTGWAALLEKLGTLPVEFLDEVQAIRQGTAALRLAAELRGEGILLVGVDGKVLAVNDAGQALLDAAAVPRLLPCGGARHSSPLADSLEEMLLEVKAPGSRGPESRPDPRREVVVVLEGTRWRIRREQLRESGDLVGFVVIARAERVRGVPRESAVGRFGLSRREALVADAFAAGKDSHLVCAEMRISKETLKTHVRHIFEKTGTSSRSQLVSLLLRTSG